MCNVFTCMHMFCLFSYGICHFLFCCIVIMIFRHPFWTIFITVCLVLMFFFMFHFQTTMDFFILILIFCPFLLLWLLPFPLQVSKHIYLLNILSIDHYWVSFHRVEIIITFVSLIYILRWVCLGCQKTFWWTKDKDKIVNKE